MKLLLAIGLFLCVWKRGGAQFFHNPQLTFEPMTFDLVHRGSFNLSYCSRELLNCWEIIKPDHMCGPTDDLNLQPKDFFDAFGKGILNIFTTGELKAYNWPVYESVCGLKREYCDDVLGDQDELTHEFGLFENYCPPAKEAMASMTRRRGAMESRSQEPLQRGKDATATEEAVTVPAPESDSGGHSPPATQYTEN